jgi:hypothetical protein
MAGERKPRLIRISPALDKALEKAAARDLRSVNFLIERILARAMAASGDLRDPSLQDDAQE